MVNGVCRFCGCTEGRPCVLKLADSASDPVTCSWADPLQTVCSQCVGQLNNEELKCLAAMDMLDAHTLGVSMLLELSAPELMCLCSLLQLAQRHPHIAGGDAYVAQVGSAVIDRIKEAFAGSPPLSELIRRGDEAAHDEPGRLCEPTS